MLIKKAPDIKSSEITPKKLYLNRREFIAGSAALAASGFLGSASLFGQGMNQEKNMRSRCPLLLKFHR